MRFRRLLFAAIAMATLMSCTSNRVLPSGEFVSYNVSAESINSIDISSVIAVQFVQSETVSVKVNCPDNIVDRLVVEVKNGKLTAGFKPGTMIEGKCAVTISVTAPSLEKIDASASSSFELTGTLVQDEPLSIDASSSAQISLHSLSVGDLDIDCSSSSSIAIGNLSANTIDIDCSSSALVSVGALRCQEIEVDAMSTATVTLKGEARLAKYSASSTASINAKALKVDTLKSVSASSTATVTYAATNCLSRSATSGGTVSCTVSDE